MLNVRSYTVNRGVFPGRKYLGSQIIITAFEIKLYSLQEVGRYGKDILSGNE